MDESLNYEAIIAQLQAENEMLRLHRITQGVQFPTLPNFATIETWLREHYIIVMLAIVIIAFIAQMIVLIADRIHP